MRSVRLTRSFVSSASRWRRFEFPSRSLTSCSSTIRGAAERNDEKLRCRHDSMSTAAADHDAAAAAGGGSGGGGFSLAQPEFDNTRLIFASKTTAELLRAYLVFCVCSLDFLVDHQTQVPSTDPFLSAVSLERPA